MASRVQYLGAPPQSAITPPSVGGGGGGSLTDDGFYIYTMEPVDANTILAEDSSRGSWYTKNCDDANNSGGLGQAGVHGWCGNIFFPIVPAGAVVDLGGGRFAASSGQATGGGGGVNMADHDYKTTANEIWVRCYIKPLSGYAWGAEKVFTLNSTPAGFGGITIGGVGVPFQDGVLRGCPWWDCNNGPVFYYSHNLTADTALVTGNWNFVEFHSKLNTAGSANGEYDLWVNTDCGSGALPVNPGGSPTKRAQFTGVEWIGPTEGTKQHVSLWMEAWSNPGTVGTRYWHMLKVSKAGPIGFCPLYS